MSILEQALDHATSHRNTLLDDLKTVASIPSVSTLPENKADVRRTAEWLAQRLRTLAIDQVEIMDTSCHPIVFAQKTVGPNRPTVLVYGHYDVQPVDPIDEWQSPPFTPTVRGENLHARGASDMKGSLIAFLNAVEALNEADGVPINLKFLLEGEEEIGSPSLPGFIDQNRELLKADVVVNCDGGIHSPTQPSIVYALRGLAYFEIEVRGPKQDLHSGLFGGSIHNPAQVLCELIAGMHDADGRVTLPGYYDRVRPLYPEERAALARVPQTDDEWKATAGVPALWGEKGYTTIERVGARPTLEVNGLISGFTGEGAKTVLPARALAKISMRLVADQDPAAVQGQLRAYMQTHAPQTVTWEVRELSHAPCGITRCDSDAMRAAVRALRETFNAEPFFKREGGTVPIVGMMQQKLGIDSIMLGFALPDDGIHGPNEKQHIPTLYKGVDTYIRFLCYFGGGQ